MSDYDKASHLQMIHATAERMIAYSFLIRAWMLTIVVAVHVFAAPTMSPVLIFAIVLAWIGDAYFSRRTVLFRTMYLNVRAKDDTDFSMDASQYDPERNAIKTWAIVMFGTGLLYASLLGFTLMRVLRAS